MNKQPKTAGEVESRCGKCKIVTLHNVKALDGEKIAQVICQICGSTHKYSPPAAEKKPAPKSAKAKSSKPSRPARPLLDEDGYPRAITPTEWRNLVEGATEDQFKPYLLNGVYQECDLIRHDSFGRGLVKRITGIGKMDVVFESGIRRLVFNRAH